MTEKTAISIREEIITEIRRIAELHSKKLPLLTDDLLLAESGLDSLSMAVLVATLDDKLELDPFSTDEDVAFPVTLGDFIKLYENAG